jgi:hypothetical protein
MPRLWDTVRVRDGCPATCHAVVLASPVWTVIQWTVGVHGSSVLLRVTGYPDTRCDDPERHLQQCF